MTALNTDTKLNEIPYLCEYSRQPFDECHCRKVTGRTVPNIALFCMDRYLECLIYRKHLLKKASSPDIIKNTPEDRKC